MTEPVFLRGPKGHFLAGNYSPGRPPGARTRYSEAFLRDFQDDWREHGAAVMARVRMEDPVAYLRIAAGLAAHLAPRPRQEPLEAPDLTAVFGHPEPPRMDPMLIRYKDACERIAPRRPEDVPEGELRALWGDELVDYFFEPDDSDPLAERLVLALERLEHPADLSDAELDAAWGPELATYWREKIRRPA